MLRRRGHALPSEEVGRIIYPGTQAIERGQTDDASVLINSSLVFTQTWGVPDGIHLSEYIHTVIVVVVVVVVEFIKYRVT